MLNYRWIWAVVSIIVLSALWISFGTIIKLWDYYTLQVRTPVESINWSIVARNGEHYLLHATYTYRVRDAIYTGETTLPAPFYRNEWAAKQALQEGQLVERRFYAWYVPYKPTFSSIYRTFPLKETIYSGIMWVLVLYFVGLIFYLHKRY